MLKAAFPWQDNKSSKFLQSVKMGYFFHSLLLSVSSSFISLAHFLTLFFSSESTRIKLVVNCCHAVYSKCFIWMKTELSLLPLICRYRSNNVGKASGKCRTLGGKDNWRRSESETIVSNFVRRRTGCKRLWWINTPR